MKVHLVAMGHCANIVETRWKLVCAPAHTAENLITVNAVCMMPLREEDKLNARILKH